MQMNQVEVSVINGQIVIAQDSENGEQDVVTITPEQAELFCSWVLEAARSLSQGGGNA